MRELRVEDALLYLDQVKVEFGDRPQIYNEFLDIMKTFKTQQIDTPGVIRRVSNLFQGNKRLVLGFNTFLPEGYKIELPADGDGPPVAVFRAPGSNVAHVLSGPLAGSTQPAQPSPQGGAGGPPPVAQVRMPLSGEEGASQQGLFGRPPTSAMRAMPLTNRSMAAAAPAGQKQGGADAGRLAYSEEERQMGHQQFSSTGQPGATMDAMRRQGRTGAGGTFLPDGQSPGLRPNTMSPQHTAAAASQVMAQQATAPPAQAGDQAAGAGANGGGQPMEFDHAINYVTTIKRRFASEPETYKKFLEILHTYQKEQRGIKEVLDEVSLLFADHPDLLKEFTYFLPDAVQAQAKVQLDAAARESEARKRNQAKQAIMNQAQALHVGGTMGARAEMDRISVPFGATQPRSVEQERLIIASAENGTVSFAPVRPPRKGHQNALAMAAKYGRPTSIPPKPVVMKTPEIVFFERAKAHLNRKELVWDKPSGAKRHTPHMEFIKCLHLYGAGILSKEELFQVLKGLFTQGHAPKGTALNNSIIAQDASNLLSDFEDILHGRGSYADQKTLEKDRSAYGTLRTRDFDFEGCEEPTPSYKSYPSDYPKDTFLTHPEQSADEAALLNKELVCVGSLFRMQDSKDAYEGLRGRYNVYEEALCRIEDEKFEVDMTIERNAKAIKDIDPLAEECARLTKREEDDGQPIGRLQYKLHPNSLDSVAIGAIARAYGDRGDEVLQHLVQNPLIVLPVIYRRLKQKDVEWRKARSDLMEQWDAATAANYEGSFDVCCYFDRKNIENLFNPKRLVNQCKKAKKYAKSGTDASSDFDDVFVPKFSIGIGDPGAVFYEPLVAVPCKVDAVHKDAIQLLLQKLQSMPLLEAFERERIGRIVSEFIVPWFGYPAHWVMDEIRQISQRKSVPAQIKCKYLAQWIQKAISQNLSNHCLLHATVAPGQRVVTSYGEGVIASFIDNNRGYRVRLAYGIATISPAAILYHVPNKDAPYIRRDGVMIRDSEPVTAAKDAPAIDNKYQILFATERIYVFLRYYVLFCQILGTIKEQCDSFPVTSLPSESYYDPKRKEASNIGKQRLDYSGMVVAFKKLISKRIAFKDFESTGRTIAKEKVALIASLPNLLHRSVESLISVAKEDALLHIYDYCQYRGCSPSLVRDQCFTMAPDAFFRVQYDQESLYFSYLPKSAEFPTAPRAEDDEIEEYTESERADESMEDEDDPIEETDDDRPSKRLKLR
jgi:paired amphipathic helix protein Sin3a